MIVQPTIGPWGGGQAIFDACTIVLGGLLLADQEWTGVRGLPRTLPDILDQGGGRVPQDVLEEPYIPIPQRAPSPPPQETPVPIGRDIINLGPEQKTTSTPEPKRRLCHGTSSTAIGSIRNGIDLFVGRPRVDFGQGFYTTASLSHAWSAAKRKGGTSAVVIFDVPVNKLNSLNHLVFSAPDKSWQELTLVLADAGPLTSEGNTRSPDIG
jgi:hypothetical protein